MNVAIENGVDGTVYKLKEILDIYRFVKQDVDVDIKKLNK